MSKRPNKTQQKICDIREVEHLTIGLVVTCFENMLRKEKKCRADL